MNPVHTLLEKLHNGDFRTLARAISLVENESEGYEELLQNLKIQEQCRMVGITGPPGAGKSTLVNALIKTLVAQGKKVGVIAVDPTSPFNYGSLLGDRIRMSDHFLNPQVFIRSLATRGSLGGLSAKAIEVTDVMRSAGFDYILIETVGVGQSEVEIAGLADTTVVVLVPEAGDEIQGIKSGLMEIADIFVVNKADREGATQFANNLKKLVHEKKASDWLVPVLETIASGDEGITALVEKIEAHNHYYDSSKKEFLLTEKAYHLIQNQRMKGVDKEKITLELKMRIKKPDFNLYKWLQSFSAKTF